MSYYRENMVRASEEISNPKRSANFKNLLTQRTALWCLYLKLFIIRQWYISRNIPLAILVAVPTITTIYLMVNVSYFAAMDIDTFLDSDTVAVVRTLAVLFVIVFLPTIMFSLLHFCYSNLAKDRLLKIAKQNSNYICKHIPYFHELK